MISWLTFSIMAFANVSSNFLPVSFHFDFISFLLFYFFKSLVGNVPTKRKESLINCTDLFRNDIDRERKHDEKTVGERLFLITGK